MMAMVVVDDAPPASVPAAVADGEEDTVGAEGVGAEGLGARGGRTCVEVHAVSS